MVHPHASIAGFIHNHQFNSKKETLKWYYKFLGSFLFLGEGRHALIHIWSPKDLNPRITYKILSHIRFHKLENTIQSPIIRPYLSKSL